MFKAARSWFRFGNVLAYVITLAVNGLASTTLLNGRTTAQVSDIYANPFTPAGYVFAIWGIIYVLLGAFVVYQALPKQQNAPFQKQISFLFILSSILNISWLFLWQYDYIKESLILMFALLACLTTIYLRLGIGKSTSSRKEKLLVHLPFQVYIGWITVASLANVAAALVSVHWDGFGLSAESGALAAMSLGMIVTLVVIGARRDYAYSLVVIWALAGIAAKPSASALVVLVAEEIIVVLLVGLGLSLLARRLRKKSTQKESRLTEELSITQTKIG